MLCWKEAVKRKDESLVQLSIILTVHSITMLNLLGKLWRNKKIAVTVHLLVYIADVIHSGERMKALHATSLSRRFIYSIDSQALHPSFHLTRGWHCVCRLLITTTQTTALRFEGELKCSLQPSISI